MKLKSIGPYEMKYGRDKRFSLSPNVLTGFESLQASYRRVPVVLWTEGKRLVFGADGVLPRSAMVKNEWSLNTALHVCFHGVYRDSCAK